MAVQRWRWWQWLLVSLAVGALLGFVFTRLDVDDTSIATRDLRFFVRHLELRTDTGEPVVDGIKVSPAINDVRGKAIQNVTFWVRQKNKTTGTWDRTVQYQVRVGQPIFDKSSPVNFATINDYLADQKAKLPSLDYRAAWWQAPNAIWALSLGGSVLVIGILWPMVIRLMVKLGLGMPEEEEEAGYDLSKVSSSSPVVNSTGVGVTAADRDQLESLNEQLEANVGGMLLDKDEEDEEEERLIEQAVIRKLEGQPLQAHEVTQNQTAEERAYGGEFYPVARPVVKKEDEE